MLVVCDIFDFIDEIEVIAWLLDVMLTVFVADEVVSVVVA